jgi:hypothetical protein
MVQLAFATLVTILTLLTSCSQSPAAETVPIPTPTPAPTAVQLLGETASQMSDLESLRFKFTHEEGSTFILDGLQAHTVFGDVALPSQANLKIEASALGFLVTIRLVISNGKAFMTDPFSGSWYSVSPSELPFNFLDLGKTLATIARKMEDPLLVNTDDPENPPYIITGTISGESLSLLVPRIDLNAEVQTELVLDENKFLQQVTLVGPVVSGDILSVTRVIEFSNFDMPVEVILPE